MNAPSIDIKDIIDADSALSLTYGTNLFVSEMPETPNQCVTIFDSPGLSPELNFTYERPGVQLRIRGNKGEYTAAHELAQAIRNVLHGTANYIINGARYILIQCEGDIIALGYDQGHRPMVSVNFQIQRTEA